MKATRSSEQIQNIGETDDPDQMPANTGAWHRTC